MALLTPLKVETHVCINAGKYCVLPRTRSRQKVGLGAKQASQGGQSP